MTTASARVTSRSVRRSIRLLVLALAALVLLLVLLDVPHLLLPAEDSADLKELRDAIARIRTPATAALGSMSGLGLLAGGAMTALGMPQGIRMMTMSGMAGGGVLLGNGIVQ